MFLKNKGQTLVKALVADYLKIPMVQRKKIG
jgi:hypothetical protein